MLLFSNKVIESCGRSLKRHCQKTRISIKALKKAGLYSFFLVWRGLGSASRAKYPVFLSNHVGFTPRLLYGSTHYSPESFTHLKTGWAQDAWLQWSYENWYFHLQTGPFTILQPQDQEIGEFYSVQERRSTDFEAPKLWHQPLITAGLV